MNQAIPFYLSEPVSDQESAFALVKYAGSLIAEVKLDVQGADKRGRLVLADGETSWILPEKGDVSRPGKPAHRKTTAQQYLAACARIAARCPNPAAILEMAQTRGTFYFYRAALVWMAAREIRRLRSAADKIARIEGHGSRYFEVINDMRTWVKVLDVFKPDPLRARRQRGANPVAPGDWAQAQQLLAQRRLRGEDVMPKRRMKQTGKRRGLSALPNSWQAQYWSWVKDSKYADAVAVLDCCGCRPSELELGVEVSLCDDGQLELYVRGTKRHGGKYGQEWRRVRLDPVFDSARHLVELCRHSSTGKVTVRVENAKNLSATMAWYSQALWPEQRYTVTPYSYRHQFRAEATGKLSTDEVAQAMGHSVDRTQNHYGTSRQARGRLGLLGVEASRMPKRTRGMEPWIEPGNHRMGSGP